MVLQNTQPGNVYSEKTTSFDHQDAVLQDTQPGRMFFSNRSVKQRQDILTTTLAANTHVIARKTQIAQCAAETLGRHLEYYTLVHGQLCFSCLL